MFYSGPKREALEALERASEAHDRASGNIERMRVRLFEERRLLGETLERAEALLGGLAHAPAAHREVARECRAAYDAAVARAAEGAASASVVASTSVEAARAGVVASVGSGVGVALASGKGMAAGNALFALSGPMGWALGGASLLGSGAYLRMRNNDIAQQAGEEASLLNRKTRSLKRTLVSAYRTEQDTSSHRTGCDALLDDLASAPADFQEFSETQRQQLDAMSGHLRAIRRTLRQSANA